MTNHISFGVESESARIVLSVIDKTITQVVFDEDSSRLRLTFADGTRIVIFDDGQECCEERYMRTDDDIAQMVGQRLLGIDIKDATRIKDPQYGDVHEVQFLEILTDQRAYTFSNHNEHNGYYGGFTICVHQDNHGKEAS